jgi:RND superfamily putative drug exporter
LVVACAPLGWLSLTPGSVEAIPAQMASARGLAVLRQSAGPGVITPLDVVVDSGRDGRAASPAMDAAVLRLADALTDQPDVFAVAIGNRPPYVDPTGRFRQMVVIERSDFGAPASQALVKELRRALVPAARFPPGAMAYVGGAAAQGADFLSRTYGALPLVICIVVAGVYLVLAAALRSALLPVVALSLDGLLAGAATGVAVALSHWGLGHHLFGTYQVAQLEGWVPIFLGALLFGLGTDYQVFFLTRMREAWDQGSSPRQAIVEGLSRSGPVVSAAALVMAGALLGLVTGQVVGLQELGFGLVAGVVLDATVVRGALMPALMALMGGRSWWPSHPASVARSAPGVLSGAGSGASLPQP